MATLGIFQAQVSAVAPVQMNDNDLTSKVYVSQADSLILDSVSNLPIYVIGDMLQEEIVTTPTGQVVRYFNMRTEKTYTKSDLDFTQLSLPQVAVSADAIYLGEFEVNCSSSTGIQVADSLTNMLTNGGFTLPSTAGYGEIYLKTSAQGSNDYLLVSTGGVPSVNPQVGMPVTYAEMKTKMEITAMKVLGVPSVVGSIVTVVTKFWTKNPN